MSISGTLREEPRLYGRWQYFYIEGYQVKAGSELAIDYGDRLDIEGEVVDGRLTSPEIQVVGQSRLQKSLFSIRENLKMRIFATMSEPQASLLAGIVLGSKESLPSDFKESLRSSGTIHVVVVSGYNISVVAGFVVGLARFIRRQIAIILALLAITLYTLLVGAEPPAVRAAIMGGLAFTAVILGRQRFSIYTLLLAGYFMTIFNPKVITDIGFQLSFLATAGIILFQGKILTFLKFLPAPFNEDLSTTLSAQSLVVPVLFYHFGSVSAISPVANAAILWTVPLATVLGFIFLAASFVSPILASIMAWFIWALLSIFVFLIEFFGKFPLAYLQFEPKELLPALAYYAFLAGVIYYLKYGRVVKTK